MGRMHEGGGVRATVARRSNKLAESPLRLPSIRTIVRLLSLFFFSFFKLLIDFLRNSSIRHTRVQRTHTHPFPTVCRVSIRPPRPPPAPRGQRRPEITAGTLGPASFLLSFFSSSFHPPHVLSLIGFLLGLARRR